MMYRKCSQKLKKANVCCNDVISYTHSLLARTKWNIRVPLPGVKCTGM